MRGLTTNPRTCSICGKPLELPRPARLYYHKECRRQATNLAAKKYNRGKGSEYQKKRYNQKKAIGQCVQCEKPSVNGKTLCQAHLDKARELQTERVNKDLRLDMYSHAKQRAKRLKVPFDLELADITIPAVCPVLGIELKTKRNGGRTNDTPSLDRIIPELGYVKGNVIVISWLANNIKGNFNADDVVKVGLWMKGTKNELQQELSPSIPGK